jgi:hypothetical protein
MKASIAPALFSVPKAPPRTPVGDAQAEAFVQAERPTVLVGDPPAATSTAAPATPLPSAVSAPKAGLARLSVDIPCSTLRALKIRAIERGTTVRDYVLGMLEREGLQDVC